MLHACVIFMMICIQPPGSTVSGRMCRICDVGHEGYPRNDREPSYYTSVTRATHASYDLRGASSSLNVADRAHLPQMAMWMCRTYTSPLNLRTSSALRNCMPSFSSALITYVGSDLLKIRSGAGDRPPATRRDCLGDSDQVRYTSRIPRGLGAGIHA